MRAISIEFHEKLFTDEKKDATSMTDLDIERYEKAYRCLKKWTKCKLFHEQDTIERLIVPILQSIGWNVDAEEKPQLIRGNRDHKSDHRNFDLNIYKDIEHRNLSIAIECKKVDESFEFPESELNKLNKSTKRARRPNGEKGKKDVSEFHGLGQLLRDYLNKIQFGRVKSGERIMNGRTVAVWTNGCQWVVVRDKEEANAFNSRIKNVPNELVGYVAPDSQLQFVFAVYSLFDPNGRFDKNEYNQLLEELSPDVFFNAAYEG